MNSIRLLIPFLLILNFLTSCSGTSEGKSEAKIILGALAGSPLTNGGVMVYGRNKDNGISFGKSLTTGNTAIELPNGNWEFIGVAWEGTNGPMTGNIRCAENNNVELRGEDIDIDLNFNMTNCDESIFGIGDFKITSGNVPDLKFIACANLFDPNDDSAKPNHGSGIVNQCVISTEMTGSFKVILPEVAVSPNFAQEIGGGITSSCSDVTFSGTSSISAVSSSIDIQAPYFNTDGPETIPAKIIIYSGASCTGTPQIVNFRDGLAREGDNAHVAKLSSDLVALVKTSPCVDAALATNKYYTGGGGTAAQVAPTFNPICTPQQFANIRLDAGNNNKNFYLATDLDMSTLGDFAPNMASGYNGEFNGAGRTIRNLTINASAPAAGLFRTTTSGAFIRNLNLVGADITSDQGDVGALIGDATGTKIKNVKISDIDINISPGAARENIGGMIGNADNVKLEFNSVENISIDIDLTSRVGGVIGRYENSPYNGTSGIQFLEVENVTITDNNTTTTVERIGGAIGALTGSGAYQIAVRGFDFTSATDASHIGGIIGSATLNAAQAKLNHLFADGSIEIDTAQNIGGIVGSLDGDDTDNVFESFYSNVHIDVQRAGAINAGGLIGNWSSTTPNPNKIIASKNTGDLECEGGNCGGLVGLMGGGATTNSNDFKIINSINTGNLDVDGHSAYGGIAGLIQFGQIISSANRGDINVTNSSSNIGGLVGSIQSDGQIINSYNRGDINGDGTTVGGFAGIIANIATSHAKKSINFGSVTGATNFNADFGNVSDCPNNSSNNYITIGTATCISAGETIDASGFTTMPEFTSLAPINASLPVGDAGIAVGGGLTSAAGIDYTTEVELGEFIKLSADNENNFFQIFNVVGPASAQTHHSVAIALAAGTTTKAGPWKFVAGAGPLLFFEEVMNIFQPDELGSINAPIRVDSTDRWNLIKMNPFLMGMVFELTESIDFNYGTFHSIGSTVFPFRGTFYGNNQTIERVRINEPTKDNVGLFGVITSGGRIESWHPIKGEPQVLILRDFDITGQNNVGSLAGAVNDTAGGGTYLNGIVVVNATVSGENKTGGVVGHASFAQADSFIEQTININGTVTQIAGIACGGVIGHLNAISINKFTGLANSSSVNGLTNVGGLIGFFDGSGNSQLEFSVNTGDVTATGNNAGGAIGNTSGHKTLRHIAIKNATISTTAALSSAGGLIGTATGNISVAQSYVRNTSVSAIADTGAFIGDVLIPAAPSSSNDNYALNVTLSNPSSQPLYATNTITSNSGDTHDFASATQGTQVPNLDFFNGTVNPGGAFDLISGQAPSLPNEGLIFSPPYYVD